MGVILCIETATEVCSVALSRDENLLGIKESSVRNVHSAMLTVFIGEIMKESGTGYTELDAVAVSMGPGSYTGLRIGVATAKGLCYALDKPLIAIPTLQSMAIGINYELKIKNYEKSNDNPHIVTNIPHPASRIPYMICPMIDARRMEVYCAVYDQNLTEVLETKAEIVDESSFSELLSKQFIVFGGDGAEKCKPILEHHENAIFMEGFHASARHMTGFAEKKLKQNQFENLAYFEPFYLKDFIAGKARVKGLNEIAK